MENALEKTMKKRSALLFSYINAGRSTEVDPGRISSCTAVAIALTLVFGS